MVKFDAKVHPFTMPPFLSTSKALRSLISRKNGIRQLMRPANNGGLPSKLLQLRCFGSVVSVPDLDASRLGNRSDCFPKESRLLLGGMCGNTVQRRGFLGCGDGEEGSALSKVYEEKRVMGYSPEQLFNVVAAVDLYEGFVPWCQRSEIVRRHPDGSFDAKLEVGFKYLVESYVSHVVLERPKYIKTTVSESSLFDHLINIWEFNPGPTPGTCNLHFLVDFKFQSPLYRQVATLFFKEVVSRLVGSFSDRCRLIYGPGVQIHEHTIEQRA